MRNFRWLPHGFKTTGLVIALAGVALVLAIICLAILEIKPQEIFPGFKEDLRDFITELPFIIILLGLTLRMLAREKEQDELILRIKLENMAASLVFAVVFAITDPFLELWLDIPYGMPLASVMALVLWFQELSFKQRKKEVFKEEQL